MYKSDYNRAATQKHVPKNNLSVLRGGSAFYVEGTVILDCQTHLPLFDMKTLSPVCPWSLYLIHITSHFGKFGCWLFSLKLVERIDHFHFFYLSLKKKSVKNILRPHKTSQPETKTKDVTTHSAKQVVLCILVTSKISIYSRITLVLMI